MYSIDIHEVDENQLLAYISYALKNDKSIVFFKLPGVDSIHIVQGSKNSFNTNEVPNDAFVWNSFLDKNKLNAIIPEEPQEDNHSFEYPFNKKEVTESTYDSYKKRMRFALEQLRAKSFEKVVVARTKYSPYSISPLALFLRLIN